MWLNSNHNVNLYKAPSYRHAFHVLAKLMPEWLMFGNFDDCLADDDKLLFYLLPLILIYPPLPP